MISKVTPSEVRRYFKDLPQDDIPYESKLRWRVQIVTLQPKIPITEIEDVKSRLREYTDRVNKGETEFSTLARMYSEDRGSAMRGGETDFMGKGMMDPLMRRSLGCKSPGKVPRLLSLNMIYHIIQLITKTWTAGESRRILFTSQSFKKS